MDRARSPFPGMDPYLESRWSDVHVKLIGFLGEAIQPLLPGELRARGEERLLLESDDPDDGTSQSYRSDVAVIERGLDGPVRPMPPTSNVVATVEPVVIRRYPAPVVDRWLQIIDVSTGNRVVTAIEILSPWNKAPGKLNRLYLQKLADYARAGVSAVEIDLLRYPARGRLPVTDLDIPLDRRSAYVACVRFGWEPEVWRAYPMPLRARLPALSIPLRQTDPPIDVDLQPLVDRVYVAGGHDDIDYSRPPDPPLGESDTVWAKQLLESTAT